VGAVPFLIAMFVLIAVLLIVPDLATWLPDVVYH
jgi:TRAP-type C4-dicarboxylate transport system permease large subunit